DRYSLVRACFHQASVLQSLIIFMRKVGKQVDKERVRTSRVLPRGRLGDEGEPGIWRVQQSRCCVVSRLALENRSVRSGRWRLDDAAKVSHSFPLTPGEEGGDHVAIGARWVPRVLSVMSSFFPEVRHH